MEFNINKRYNGNTERKRERERERGEKERVLND